MTGVSLNTILIGFLLLIFNDHSSSSAPCSPPASGSSRCVTDAQFRDRVEKLRRHTENLEDPKSPRPDNRTCAQAAQEMHGDLKNRSLSPWRYRIDRDDDRFPPEIYWAECLCQGCIIDRHEDYSYDSVPVYTVRMVLKRTRCESDKNKYRVEKDFIKVPVACTCVVPKVPKGGQNKDHRN